MSAARWSTSAHSSSVRWTWSKRQHDRRDEAAKATELLKLQRAMFPPKALPARITSQDSQHHDEHHPVNGRFVPNDDESAR